MQWVIVIIAYMGCAEPVETVTQYRYETREACEAGIRQQAAQLEALKAPGGSIECQEE